MIEACRICGTTENLKPKRKYGHVCVECYQKSRREWHQQIGRELYQRLSEHTVCRTCGRSDSPIYYGQRNCNRCRSEKNKLRNARPESKERVKAWNRTPEAREKAKIRKQAPGSRRADFIRQIWARYRLTPDRFDAFLIEQCGTCPICNVQLLDLHVDHDHETGEVRALLCGSCNRALGSIETPKFPKYIAYLSAFSPTYRLYNTIASG